jgi:hypothetical protein
MEGNDKRNDEDGNGCYRPGAEMTVWFGHTNRMGETRWPRKVLKWVPQEKCKQGQPRWGWRDDIKAAVVARDLTEGGCYRRKDWKRGGEMEVAVK